MHLLKFSKGNAKLEKDIYTFSIPAGYSCPNAKECFSFADKATGKIRDGKYNNFRCFAASMENRFPLLRKKNWNNFNLLKKSKDMAGLILASLPAKAKIVRIHVGGDFFSEEYFDAWLTVALEKHDVKFYFYTKNISWWKKRENLIGNGHSPGILRNVVPTASYGGKEDNLIGEYGYRSSFVVFREDDAKRLGLEIDHDDSHAMNYGPSFALLLHGIQPPNSSASAAWFQLKKEGKAGYSKNKKISLL